MSGGVLLQGDELEPSAELNGEPATMQSVGLIEEVGTVDVFSVISCQNLSSSLAKYFALAQTLFRVVLE